MVALANRTLIGPHQPIQRAGRYLRELWSRREFAWYLAAGNLRAKHASTVLGLSWWILNPLLLAAVYFIVFGNDLVFGSRGEQYVAYLLSGIFVFHFTHRAMSESAASILSNQKLLINLKFPRLVLPISALLESSVGFLFSLVVLYLVVIPLYGIYPGFYTLWLLVMLPLLGMLNLGLGSLVARMAVPFRDIQNLLPYLTRLWLYLSPIIWPLSVMEEAPQLVQTVVEYNPMYSMIGMFRTALLGYPLQWSYLWLSIGWSALLLVIGMGSFIKFERHMVRHL